ncbi:MAG: type II secretion system protein GspG [Oligoflexus sp.]|nr:type II secretion system protein GspG [Oligoflexus sp.]
MKKVVAGLLLLIVLGIAFFAWRSKNLGNSKKLTESQEMLTAVTQGLQQFKLHNYKYPTTEQGLQALLKEPSGSRMWRGPYLSESQLKDSWGRAFQYEATQAYGFRLVSSGPDGTFANDDDIVGTNF